MMKANVTTMLLHTLYTFARNAIGFEAPRGATHYRGGTSSRRHAIKSASRTMYYAGAKLARKAIAHRVGVINPGALGVIPAKAKSQRGKAGARALKVWAERLRATRAYEANNRPTYTLTR